MADSGSLPDVSFAFRPDGVQSVLQAFKSIEDAAKRASSSTSAEEIKQSRVRVGMAKLEADTLVKLAKVGADAQIKEARRATDEKARLARVAEAPRDVFGNRVGAGGDRGLRQISGSRAFEQIFGKTAAQLAGLQGAGGALVGTFSLLRSGIALATSALTQFGGYLLSDIIKPQLKLGTTSTQIANRIGGNAGAIQGQINSLYKGNAQVDLNQVTAAFSKAADIVKDPAKAGKVADIALQANKAYGYDPMKMTEFVARKRAANMGMGDAQFGGMMSGQIALAQKNGAGTVEDLISSIGSMSNMKSRFAITSPDGTINQAAATARENELTGLLTASTAKGGNASGLSALMNDMTRNAPGKATYAGTGTLKPLMETLPALIASVSGDVTKLGPTSKAGQTIGSLNMGKGYSQKSVNELRALGLGETYQSAELKQKGSGADAVSKQLQELLNPASQAAKLAEDAKKVEADTGYQLDAAMRDLQMTLVNSMLPVLKEEGPKIAAEIKAITEGLSGVDLVGVFKTLAQALSAVIMGILDLGAMVTFGDTSKTLKDMRAKVGVASGLESSLGQEAAGTAALPKGATLDKFGDYTALTYAQGPGPTPEALSKDAAKQKLLGMGVAQLGGAGVKATENANGGVDLSKLAAALEKSAGASAELSATIKAAGIDPARTTSLASQVPGKVGA